MACLRDDAALLRVAIDSAAQASGIPAEHVEKDFWLTECLRALAAYGHTNGVRILFKGGTSLSKAYRLIRRFSEDADTVVVFGDESQGTRDRHLKGFVAACGGGHWTGSCLLSDDLLDCGEQRVVRLTYGIEQATPQIDPWVKVELHTVGGVSPHATVELSSIISEYWGEMEGTSSRDEFDELAPFRMEVVEPCRTLVEKLVILHEAHTRDGGSASRRKADTVRHYYDVWCLLGDEETLAALARPMSVSWPTRWRPIRR